MGKIGNSTSFTASSSDAKSDRTARLAMLGAEKSMINGSIERLKLEIQELSEKDPRQHPTQQLIAQLETLRKDVVVLKHELEAYKDVDPRKVEQKREKIIAMQAEAERWTNNIAILECWLRRAFDIDERQMDYLRRSSYGTGCFEDGSAQICFCSKRTPGSEAKSDTKPMQFSNFSNLPPEVILKIFQCVSDFATVNALVRTSSVFHCTWLMNANSIALTVLPKTIECYDQARSLVEAQEWAEECGHHSGGRHQSHREVVIVLVRRYLENSRLITGYYESNIRPVLERLGSKKNSRDPRPLLERPRFLKTLYNFKTLAVIHETDKARPSTLSNVQKSELIDLAEVASWFRRSVPVQQRLELGVDHLLADGRWLQGWLDSHLAALHKDK
ncbi:MAG: hypothetical protein Q9216_003627 [Gyalolechia sp. 2 TL-2023]